MGYEELNGHYESLNKDKIEKYNNSYQKYLDNHERNIGNKYPPLPENEFNNCDQRETDNISINDFEYRF